MNECIFCKIAAGEIPSEKVFEDEKMLAFLDANPKAPGHTLLIPKAHYQWFQDLPDEISDDLFRRAKQVAKEMKERTGADYIRLGIVGTDVPHMHLHLIPQHLSQKTAEI